MPTKPTALHLPRLDDEGLVLRGFLDSDVPLVQAASRDPLIPMITTVPGTAGAAEALAFVHRQRARSADGVGYSFAIADASTDEALGQIGLWPQAQGRASVGYWVAEPHRGRGVAVRALTLVSRWAWTLPTVHRIELCVEPWNEASWRTAERVGYQREGLLRQWQDIGGQRRDMFLYSLLRTD